MLMLLEPPRYLAGLLYFPTSVFGLGVLALSLAPGPIRAYVWSIFRAVKATPYGVMTSLREAVFVHGLFAFATGLWCPRRMLMKDVEAKFRRTLSSNGGDANDDELIVISYSCRTIFYCIIRALLEKAMAEKGGECSDVTLRICTCSLHYGSFYKLLRSMRDENNGSSLIEFYEIDLKQEDWSLDESKIDEEEVGKCDLILCQNFFGVPFQQERLFRLGHKKNIPILEDCVQSGSLFGKYKGHPLADVHIWSGGLDKTPACLGGGFARFSSSSPHGQFLHGQCLSRHASFPIETISGRFQRLIAQTAHLMIAKNSLHITLNVIVLISTLFLRDSKKLSLHELALAVRRDTSLAPFQHDLRKFCKRPSAYHLLSMQYGFSQAKTYSSAIEREREGLELLIGSIPGRYRQRLFPMWTDKTNGIHVDNKGISEFTWVAADGAENRYRLANFLTQHSFISLINTTWECHGSNDNSKVARNIASSLLYLPNILELEKHQIVLMAQVLTKWCKQQEMAELKKRDQSKCQAYTVKEVALHCTADDFWTIVDDEVYDLSGYSGLHPGGSIIMNAAGTDGTVLFNQYHLYNPDVAKSVLSKYHIGHLKDETHTSPKMGPFYETVALRAKDILTGVPRRPTAAKVSWAIDASLMTFFLVLSCFVGTDWPLPILILLHLAIPTVSSLRMEGQQHANGHVQIFGPRLSWWAELYGYFLGVPAMFSYGVPGAQENTRRTLNGARKQAQFEFPEGRGFAEHMAIHHVRGAELEHDQCFQLVSVLGILRLSDRKMPHRMQQYQSSFWFMSILDIVVEAADCTKLPFFVPRLRYAFEYLLSDGEYVRGGAILFGTFSSFAISWCYLALPVSGYIGFGCFVCLGLLKEYLGLFGVQVFFAQHVWDNSTEEEVANTDWGRYNAASCYSWWGRGRRDVLLYPFLWSGASASDEGRSCPSTLTYHLEHTLFPGVSYMYLNRLAPVIRSTCDEFGIKYNYFATSRELLKERQEKLRLYSVSKFK